MPQEIRTKAAFVAVCAVAAGFMFSASALQGQDRQAGAPQLSDPQNSAPNPYRMVENWARMPEGRKWGSTSAVDVDRAGHIWVAERCGANSCTGRPESSVVEFDSSGRALKTFGAGLFSFPHGMHVDHEGNVWVTDAEQPDGTGGPGGHQVIKFSREGKVLMTMGRRGQPGNDKDHFNRPSDVITTAKGEIFVADGHGGESNARIVKFAKDGKYIKEWGKKGTGPGEFDTPHALALDSRGRLFVGDRGNGRIQVFDQEGKFIEEMRQFGMPSGIAIDANDMIYVADSESNTMNHPGWKRGVRVGSLKDGKVTAFIPDPEPNADSKSTSAAEGVAVDASGVIYGAEVGPMALKKYVKQ